MSQTLFIFIVSESSTIRSGLSVHLQRELVQAGVRGVSQLESIRTHIQSNQVDTIILDIEAKNPNLKNILQQIIDIRRIPVLLFGSDIEEDLVKSLREYNVMGFVKKPEMGIKAALPQLAELLGRSIQGITGQHPAKKEENDSNKNRTTHHKTNTAAGRRTTLIANLDPLIAIGSSTGGTIALETLLKGFPQDTPGIVIAQHMPKTFTGSFSERLNGIVAMHVREAQSGDIVQRGQIFIAPGDQNMTIFLNKDKKYEIALEADRIFNKYRPSVDLLFNSVAETAHANAVGAILTGMGDDGARGLLKMRHAGARTLAQDEKSCVVYGMPKVAVELNAAEIICSLEKMAEQILKSLKNLGAHRTV